METRGAGELIVASEEVCVVKAFLESWREMEKSVVAQSLFADHSWVLVCDFGLLWRL